MFCGMVPCECNKPAKPKPVVKATVAPIVTSVAPPVFEPSKSNAIVTGPTFEKHDEDPIMSYAVNVFLDSGMLSRPEEFRLRNRFGRAIPQEIKARVFRWKERHNATKEE